MALVTKSAERRRWTIVVWLFVVAFVFGILFFQQDRVIGIPKWLKALALLDWLRSLEPLDKWLTFIGATLIGLYAIFHETLWAWLRRPKLIITFDTVPPYCIPMPIRVSYKMLAPVDTSPQSLRVRLLTKKAGNAGLTLPITVDLYGQRPDEKQNYVTAEILVPSFQVRILVKNAGSTRAPDVEVYAQKLRQKEGTEYVPVTWFLPMNLVWANEERAYIGISKDVERTCNILGIRKASQIADPQTLIPHAPPDFNYETNCVVRLHTLITPTSYCNVLFPGEYILDLMVTASNAKTAPLSVAIAFDGRWFDDQATMFQDALKVSVE
jgi:hypothetical protein